MSPAVAKSDRTWWLVGLVFALLWIVYLVFFGPKMPSGAPTLEPLANEVPANFGWKVADINDEPVDLARYRGRPIFLNVWATWCGPCVGEMPSIAQLAEEPRMKDVVFLCVSVDQSSESIRSFLKGKSWKMTVLHALEPPPEVFQTQGIPATFLIGPDGKIASEVVGGAQWDDDSVIAFLERLKGRAGGGPARAR